MRNQALRNILRAFDDTALSAGVFVAAISLCIGGAIILAARTPPADAPASKTVTLHGTIRFTGPMPQLPKRSPRVAAAADCSCSAVPLDKRIPPEELAINKDEGTVRDAIVFVSSKVDDSSFDDQALLPPTEPIVVNQHLGTYSPHIILIRLGQQIEFRNLDKESHLIVIGRKINAIPAMRQWEGDPPILWKYEPHPRAQGDATTTKENQWRQGIDPPVILPLQDGFHFWMTGYIGVFNNPYFAVSDEHGKFEIKGLKPGHTYELTVFHGLKSIKPIEDHLTVTVPTAEDVAQTDMNITFTYQAITQKNK